MSPFIHLYTSYVQILDRNYAEISPHKVKPLQAMNIAHIYANGVIRRISTNGLTNTHTNRSRKVEILRENLE